MAFAFRLKGLNFYLSTSSHPLSRPGPSSFSSPPEDPHQPVDDRWLEIDRHNDHVLHPIHGKSSQSSSRRLSFYPPLSRTSKKGFHLNSPSHSRTRQGSSQRLLDDPTGTNMNPSVYLNKYLGKQSSLAAFNSESTFLFGNSIIKSNKAEILNAIEQQLLLGEESNCFVDRHGVLISEDGPFWPDTYRILHPTPKLLNRTIVAKEFYLSPSVTGKTLLEL